MSNLKEYQQEIEKLIAEENLPKAYEICNRILSYDPENSTFIRLKHRIEKTVQEINRKAIREELQGIEHLLAEKKYAEYLKSIAPLQTYVNQYPEIARKILQAKKLLDQEYSSRREQAYQEILHSLRLGKNLDYQEIIQKLENFSKLGIHVTEIRQRLRQVRRKYIAEQIRLNHGLINSAKFEDILIFLLKLKKIDPQNKQILQLISRVNESYRDFKIESRKDFIFKTEEEIKTLYLKKKYDYCVELCRRVLEIDSQNSLAAKYLTRAQSKSNIESERQIITSIRQFYRNFPQTKDYRDRNYIRI